ncbi:MAG: ABC transporter ATP-binding protein, partial [Gammaproteobacteria bacterium]
QAHVDLRLAFFRDLTLQHAFLETATGLGGLAIVVVGASLAASGQVEAAFLPLMTLLALSAFLPISEIAEVSRQLADTLGATRRIEAVWRERPVVSDGEGVLESAERESGRPEIDTDAPALEMSGVTFSYPGFDALALRDVNLTVPRGHTVALGGSSGAGKTTIAHLFLRFWDPQLGVVSMHGRDLRERRLADVRASIALVGQDTYLFNQSLRDNIALARPDATEDEIRLAASRASLDDFIASLPQGLDTPVGERGARLSGGQRQRIAIARAFLKDAALLVLDEATSSLDAVNEAAVRSALHELMHDRTTVVIAHRLSTVRDADHIYVLDRGSVVEHGTHESLLDTGGFYSRLVGRQLTAAAAE